MPSAVPSVDRHPAGALHVQPPFLHTSSMHATLLGADCLQVTLISQLAVRVLHGLAERVLQQGSMQMRSSNVLTVDKARNSLLPSSYEAHEVPFPRSAPS